MLKQKNVALFGGSFDPPHNGHIAIINCLNNIDWLTEIIVLPAYQSPFKTKSNTLPQHRINMLKKGMSTITHKKKIEVSDYEIQHAHPLFTIDTLTYFKTKNPQNSYHLIIGSDHLFQFKKWARYEEILNTHQLIVFNRKKETKETLENYISNTFTPKQHAHIQVIIMPEEKSASSELRQSKSFQENCPLAVRNYIEKHKIYQ